MKSLRLDSELEERLQRAATVTGESLSQFVRQAAVERAKAVLNTADREDFADVLSAIHGGGGQARRTGQAFGGMLAERQRSVWPLPAQPLIDAGEPNHETCALRAGPRGCPYPLTAPGLNRNRRVSGRSIPPRQLASFDVYTQVYDSVDWRHVAGER